LQHPQATRGPDTPPLKTATEHDRREGYGATLAQAHNLAHEKVQHRERLERGNDFVRFLATI
jgi:hypothetical protein